MIPRLVISGSAQRTAFRFLRPLFAIPGVYESPRAAYQSELISAGYCP
jgi:hypothetical protein